MFTLNEKRINIFAPYETQDGTRYGNLANPEIRAALGVVEIPDPQPPEDYSEETYYRTEQDTAPYIVFTKKSDEQITAAHNARVWAEVDAIERKEMFPRTLREFLMEQPGAANKPWFAKLKSVDDEIVALKAKLK